MRAYSPEYEGPIAGWTVNNIQANLWRVERVTTREDLLQDSHVIFWRCARKYAGVEARHFMALYQRAWRNHLHDLSTSQTKRRAEVSATMEGAEGDHEYQRDGAGDLDCSGELAVKLRQAPREVSQVLSLFLNAPQELLEIALASWHGQRDRRTRAGGSAVICRLLGLPEDRDVMSEVEAYFS